MEKREVLRHMALSKDQIRELILEAPDHIDDRRIEFDEDARRAWAKIVSPHRFVMVPDYILKSWIPTLGASRTLLALAFRQVAYISKCKELVGEEEASASIEQLSRWSGLSVGGVHKILSDPGFLTWFVNGIGSKTDGAGNTYTHRDRRSYGVRIDIPLTPADQFKIRKYLEAHVPANDSEWPLVLYDAPQAVNSHIPKSAELPSEPRTVQEIVRELRGMDQPLTRAIDEACVELYDQWVHPGFFGRATHYFIQRWVPELSTSLACLVLWARRRAYLDSQLDEVRFLRLRSDQQLADAIGVSARTIRRIKNDPLGSLFLSFSHEEQFSGVLDDIDSNLAVVDGKPYRLSSSSESDEGLGFGDPVKVILETFDDGSSSVLQIKGHPNGDGDNRRKQAVRMRVRVSDPIHPDDWKRYETLLGIEDAPGLWSEMNASWTKVNASVDKSEVLPEVNENLSEVNNDQTKVNTSSSNVNSDETELNDTLPEVNALKDSLEHSSKESLTKGIKQLQQDTVVVVANSGWDIQSILRNGAVKKHDRQQIMDEWISRGIEFIAHLLFGLSQETIKSPVLFAARRFIDREEPSSELLKLAQRDPLNLAIQLRRSGSEPLWRDGEPIDQLVKNGAYDELVRLEAFDFSPDASTEVDDVEDDLEGQYKERYVQLSFVEDERGETSPAIKLWGKVKDQLEQDIPAASYERWVKPAVGIEYDNDILTVGVEDEFARDWLDDRVSSTARNIVTGINAHASEIRFVVIQDFIDKG
jgi:AraC-like DNA-binding protein